MRHAALCSVLLTCACTGNVEMLPGPKAIDAGWVAGGNPTEIAGRVMRSLCETVEGATVQALDGDPATALSGPDGRFTLTAPEHSALLVTAPGRVPTLTFQRDFTAASTDELAAAVPSDISLLLHALASFELRAEAGTVVFAVLDGAPLPITDVEVTLLDSALEPVPANARRRYVTFDGTVPRLLDSQGTGPNGIAAFFNVPPGRYVLHLERAGYTFVDRVVPVRGGTITLDLVRGEGSGATQPVPFPGLISAFARFPTPATTAAPLPDASVTLTMEDGATFEARTDATGAYLLALPRVGAWFDVTATSAGYEPVRSKQACAGHFAFQHFSLEDAFYLTRFKHYALGSVPIDADAGALLLSPPLGATLALEPPAAPPFYGQDGASPVSCVRGTCADGGACPSGTRCESGECVLGAASALCQACDVTPCPMNYGSSSLLSADGGTSCRCLPPSGSCSEAAPACEEGTYCWNFTGLDAGSLVVTTSACLLYTSRFPATGQNGSLKHPVMFANVRPGLYTLHASLDGGVLGEPIRLRVSSGVMNNFSVP